MIKDLNPSVDGTRVESIDLDIQASPKNEVYNPFVTINVMEAWPNEPVWNHLNNGDELKVQNYNFETYYNLSYTRIPKKLIHKVDYDIAVLSISLGALPYIAHKLMSINSYFDESVRGMYTTPTFGVQLWFNQNSTALQFPKVKHPNELR